LGGRPGWREVEFGCDLNEGGAAIIKVEPVPARLAAMAKLMGVELYGRITRIHISSPTFDDTALQSLAGIRSLKSITLSNTKVTDSGLQQLSGKDRIEEILIGDGNREISDASLVALTRALPGCAVSRIAQDKSAVSFPSPR
jgi:hypothetical protein